MDDTLSQLNDFLKDSNDKVKVQRELQDALKIREQIMKDPYLVEQVEAFIKGCPDSLGLDRTQLEYVTYVFLTYLISTGAVKIFKY